MTSQKKTYIALFTYGGGMRGLIPAHIMSRIEDRTGLRMAQMVDIFAGPSTGSILNAAMTVRHPERPDEPKYKARHLVRFYEREGLKIFPPDRFRAMRGLIHDFNNRTMRLSQLNWLFKHGHYEPKNLQRALKMLYGKAGLQDTLKSLVIPVYNIDGGQIEVVEEFNDTGDSPVRTKNNFYDHGGHAVWLKHMQTGYGIANHLEVPLVDAVMASAAAPTYFPCHHFPVRDTAKRTTRYLSGIDGSIFDNPCISYHGAIRSHIPPDANLIMIILGTGFTNKSITKEEWNRMGALGVVDPVNDLPLINIFFHASETALIESFATELGDDLFVFNKSLLSEEKSMTLPNAQMDDADLGNLQRLKDFSEGLMDDNQSRFDQLCDLLVRNYEESQKEPEQKKPGFFKMLLGSD